MSWDTSRARDVSFTVRVNGVIRQHEPSEISWAQDITSDLPSAVTAGGQVSQRTGRVVWARETPVETRTPSPWQTGGVWLPTVGDAVTIDAHDAQGNTYRVFTGLIDTVEGDAFGNRSSKIVAPIVGERQTMRMLALTQSGGLPTEGNIGHFATTPVWTVHEVNRALGYTSVPPAPAVWKRILDAPLQGSTYNYSEYPARNASVVVSHRIGYPTLHPLWAFAQDGFGVSNALVEWVPYTGDGTGAGAVGVSLVVFSPHSGDALVRIRHGASADTYLRVLANRTVRVSTYVGGVLTANSVSAPLPSGDGPHLVSAVFHGGSVSVLTPAGIQTFSSPTPTPAVSRITLEANAGSCVAGLQVWHPSAATDHHAQGWTPTAKYRYGTGTYATTVTPAVRDRRAGEVLNDYADALLSPMWVDGHGVLQVVTGKALHTLAPALTVDALRDVSDLGYSMSLLDHRPTVEVTYAHAFQTNVGATDAKTTVWQGSGGEVFPDAPDETFVEVPDDEEWVGLASPASAERLTYLSKPAFQTGVGSWWGLAEEVTSEGDLAIAGDGAQTVETLTPWAWKITTTFPKAAGAVQKVEESVTMKSRYRGVDLPIYRARGRVKYEDRTVAVSSPTPGAGEVLSHDTGKWVTLAWVATELAEWIHSMVSEPTPILENLVVRFDPRLDVGMKITVRAQRVFGVDFEALVLSVDHAPGDDTTSLVARVTKVTASAGTFNDVDYAHIGQSLTQWDQARAGKTLNQVATSPYL